MGRSGGEPLSSDSVTATGCIADGSTLAPLSSDSVTTIEEARSHTQNTSTSSTHRHSGTVGRLFDLLHGAAGPWYHLQAMGHSVVPLVVPIVVPLVRSLVAPSLLRCPVAPPIPPLFFWLIAFVVSAEDKAAAHDADPAGEAISKTPRIRHGVMVVLVVVLVVLLSLLADVPGGSSHTGNT